MRKENRGKEKARTFAARVPLALHGEYEDLGRTPMINSIPDSPVT